MSYMLKNSSIPGEVPTIDQLSLGEIALNSNDGKMFFIQNQGTPFVNSLNLSTDGPSNVYTANGSISVYDGLSIINASNTTNMVLPNGRNDRHRIMIKRIGNGSVNINSLIDGQYSTLSFHNNRSGECVTLEWNTSISTWLILNYYSGVGVFYTDTSYLYNSIGDKLVSFSGDSLVVGSGFVTNGGGNTTTGSFVFLDGTGSRILDGSGHSLVI